MTRLWEMPIPHGGNPEYTDPHVEAMGVEEMLQEAENIRIERAELEAQTKAEQESPRGQTAPEVYEKVSADDGREARVYPVRKYRGTRRRDDLK